MQESRRSSAGWVGAVVDRERLLRRFEGRSEPLVVLAAPGGCGKSILATQVAGRPPFAGSHWVSFDAQCHKGQQVVRALVAEMSDGSREDYGHELALLSSTDLLAQLNSELSCTNSSPVCIVLDGIDLGETLDEVMTVVQAVRTRACPGSCVVVATRSTDADLLARLDTAWIVEASDLAFDEDEARELAFQLLGYGFDERELDDAFNSSAGHPALLSVFLRHSRSVSDTRVPATLAARLVGLAREHLDARGQECLLVCALLGRGDLRDVEYVVGDDCETELATVAACVPLVRLSSHNLSFDVHDLARDALLNSPFEDGVERADVLRDRACLCLQGARQFERLFELLLQEGSGPRLSEALRAYGEELLTRGNLDLLSRCLARVPVADQVSSARMILLSARCLLLSGDGVTALGRAGVALELATHEGDNETAVLAQILRARVSIDSGQLEAAVDHLEDGLELLDEGRAPNLAGLVYSHLIICSGHLGRVREAVRYRQLLSDVASIAELKPHVRAYALHASSLVTGLVEGKWSEIAAPLLRVGNDVRLPIDLRLRALNNSGGALLHMGRTKQAAHVVCEVMDESERCGLVGFVGFAKSGLACIEAAEHRYATAEQLLRESYEDCDAATEPGEDPAFLARWRRAAGELDLALQATEAGLAWNESAVSALMWRRLTEIERSACILALGDCHQAQADAAAIRKQMAPLEAHFHLLLADLVLAEAARQQGRHEEAVARLLEHAQYVQSESANLSLAFYIRAFPGLLGVLARAVGIERLPCHMLRLLNEVESERCLRIAWDEMEREEWDALAARLLEEAEAAALAESLEGQAPCRVRLFGGLEVITPDGVVPDRAWRKRKARLLFAMLVARQGQDVPREQLLDHLWPEMDDDKARNNFYVVWNTLKGALSPNLAKGEACPFVESVGGLCRVASDMVSSDLDEFEELLTRVREAEDAGEPDVALAAYRRLGEVYRGEILPGDIYDDWFGPLRERCKQQFGDAMISLAKLHADRGNSDAALHALRRALDQDPLREDIYQEMLRAQIGAGQRSAAVDTYLACRLRLSEDLGLDPSVETRLLYDQVLAMEDSMEEPGGVDPSQGKVGVSDC